MDWALNHWAEILVIAGFLERFAKETKEDFVLFGIPIGKYDNQISDFVKAIIRAALPGK